LVKLKFKFVILFILYCYSAQRHNKLFRSRSESNLSEPSVSEEPSGVATRLSLSHIHTDDPNYVVSMHEFDLNRRLLDITSAGNHKVMFCANVQFSFTIKLLLHNNGN